MRLQPADGNAWVTCWCETNLVQIPTADIGVTTRSCGARHCGPPCRLCGAPAATRSDPHTGTPICYNCWKEGDYDRD